MSDSAEVVDHELNSRHESESSREQTPHAMSKAVSKVSNPRPGTRDYNAYGAKEGEGNTSLTSNEAIVKTPEPEVAESTIDSTLAVKETFRKRISGKAIDKQWMVCENEPLRSFESLLEISANNVLERFKFSKRKDSKIAETQRILTQHWLSNKLPKSFLARFKVTKLPSSKTLMSKMRGDRDRSFDPFNIDQVKLHKTIIEAYLSAELKQLESLESYRISLQNTFDSDYEYLADFKKTTSNLMGQISQEREKTSRELHLEVSSNKQPNTNFDKRDLATTVNTSIQSRFEPDNDDDLKPILRGLRKEASRLDDREREVLKLCDQLDIIERQLYTRSKE